MNTRWKNLLFVAVIIVFGLLFWTLIDLIPPLMLTGMVVGGIIVGILWAYIQSR